MTTDRNVRIDKWLWAARFFKTRSLASEAVSGGKVHVNGSRVKPAKTVAVGDSLRIQRGEVEMVVSVLALSERRGPATEAQELYEETEASRLAREANREQRRLLAAERAAPAGRPNKRDRRLIRSFILKDD
ncbi:MAG: S4 domain-containing protein [Desulfobulbaceae bacterium]|nr:S4 domain-containing protein [Desulfobulbaceae bacterium]